MSRLKDNPWPAALLIAVILVTTGCSWQEDFVFLNLTSSEIHVEYWVETYQTYQGETMCPLVRPYPFKPQVVPVDRIGRTIDYKHKSPVQEFTVDKGQCSIQLVLEPGLGVVVWSSSNGDGDPPLRRVLLAQGGRTISFDKAALLRSFDRRSRYLYAIDVEAV